MRSLPLRKICTAYFGIAYLLASLTLLTACGTTSKDLAPGSIKQSSSYWPSWLNWIRPYQPPVSQGVFITKEMVSQLKGGMTQDQVRYLLGNPPLQDSFHKDRWDYPFRYDNGKGVITTSSLAVFFNADKKLVSLQGGKFPNETEFIKLIDANL